MSTPEKLLLSVVVPIYNEAPRLKLFHDQLIKVVGKLSGGSYEVFYCDDGSSDNTSELVKSWHEKDDRIKLISFSRNFGKENALSAGISASSGDAILMLDGDGQHPVSLIPEFIDAWRRDSRVVIGIRKNAKGGKQASLGSRLFYKLFNSISRNKLMPGSTDFCLIDKSVQVAFKNLRESNRITRGLIDWLGFEKKYVYFEAPKRLGGRPAYGVKKRLELAANSFVSLTPQPLYIFGYVGAVFTSLSFILGILVIVEQLILDDPLHWKFTGTAMLGILIIFLVGLLLIAQAILSLYIANIQSQSQNRPLYVIDYKKSVGINSEN